MTDISKCNGEGCKDKRKCLRYTAPAGYMQAYSEFDKQRAGKECKYFWEKEKLND